METSTCKTCTGAIARVHSSDPWKHHALVGAGHKAEPSGNPVTLHVEAVCKEAGLGTMAEIIGIVRDREQIEDDELLSITAETITRWYESFIAPGIDQIENEILDEEIEEVAGVTKARCAECGKAGKEPVLFNARTGDQIEWDAPGGHVIANVIDSYPSHLYLGTKDGAKFMLTYAELKRKNATFVKDGAK